MSLNTETEGMTLLAKAAQVTEVTTGISQKSGKPYARFRTTLVGGGGIYQFTQYAESEAAKVDADGRAIYRFTAGQPIRIQVRPEFLKGVPIVQLVRGDVVASSVKL